jgi:hypothetical protein
MAEVCAAAGSWQADCHAEWVLQQSRLHALAPAALLDACGPSSDCALQQLDAHPSSDVLAQIAACKERTGRYADDCVAHAVQRWAAVYPAAPEVERVVAGTPNDAVQVGTFVGMIAACAPASDAPVRCPDGGGLYGEACRRAATGYGRDAARCGGVLPGPE